MGTRPGLRLIPHISGILLLMQLLLLQPLVDAKAKTSAAVDPRSVPASPAKMTDFKQEGDAHGFRVFITFEGNPHYRGIEELVKVSTNGWNKTFSEPRDNTKITCDSTWISSGGSTCQRYAENRFCAHGTYGSGWKESDGTFENWADSEGRTALVCPQCGCKELKRTFEFVIPEEFKFHQFAIIFGKEVHFFQLKATGFEENAVYRKYVGLVNYLSEKVKYMMPDYGVGWMSQVVWKELDNIYYTHANLYDHLRQLKTDVESIEAKLPDSFNDFVTIGAFQASETKISGLKSEMTQTEEALETKISGLESEIAQMKATSKTKINELESKIAQMEKASETKISSQESEIAQMNEVTGFSLRTAVSNRHIKYIFVGKNMDRDTAETACTLLNGTLATPSTYDEFDFLDSHMEQGDYHLGAQCKDCTYAGDDKWEWSTGEPLSLRFGKWGSSSLRHGPSSWLFDRGPYPYGNEDDINLFAIKPSCAAKLCQAYLINFNVKTSGHAICQENIA